MRPWPVGVLNGEVCRCIGLIFQSGWQMAAVIFADRETKEFAPKQTIPSVLDLTCGPPLQFIHTHRKVTPPLQKCWLRLSLPWLPGWPLTVGVGHSFKPPSPGCYNREPLSSLTLSCHPLWLLKNESQQVSISHCGTVDFHPAPYACMWLVVVQYLYHRLR